MAMKQYAISDTTASDIERHSMLLTVSNSLGGCRDPSTKVEILENWQYTDSIVEWKTLTLTFATTVCPRPFRVRMKKGRPELNQQVVPLLQVSVGRWGSV
jgi:hypothetical protein